MNLAFPALCILLLALPGVLFRKAFARAAVPIRSFKGKAKHVVNKYPVSIRPITEEISISLVWTIILHVVWLALWSKCNWFGQPINYEHIVRVLHGSSNISGGSSSDEYGRALNYFAEHHVIVVKYFLSLYVVSFCAGRFFLFFVRWSSLDHLLMIVRLDDQWFYFLRGEIFKFAEFRKFFPPDEPVPEVCGTYVSIVVPQSGRDYLYKGFLWDFDLDREGKLDRLVLHHAIRTEFAPERLKTNRKLRAIAGEIADAEAATPSEDDVRIEDGHWNFQRVSSQLFTVRYADCKTLACTYFYIRRKVA